MKIKQRENHLGLDLSLPYLTSLITEKSHSFTFHIRQPDLRELHSSEAEASARYRGLWDLSPYI